MENILTKICSKCKIQKNINDFRLSMKSGRQAYCIMCQKEYDKERYQKFGADRRKQIKEREEKTRDKIREYLITLKSDGCLCCFETDPCCIDFHHLRDKDFNLANAQRRIYSIERINKELIKCVTICSNCHRKIHHNKIILLDSNLQEFLYKLKVKI